MSEHITSEQKKKNVFIEGAISPSFIAEQISRHGKRANIGAHTIFLGQVRSDVIDGKTVQAIEYSCYEEMAEKKLSEIREAAFAKYDLICMHIFHSVGRINAGEICLFVFVSSKHRKNVFSACSEIIEQIKVNVPIFGKEIFEDETYTWKQNNHK